MTAETALTHGKTFRIFAKAKGFFSQCFVIYEMLGEDTHPPGTKGRRIEPFVHYTYRQGVNYLHMLDRFVVCDSR